MSCESVLPSWLPAGLDTDLDQLAAKAARLAAGTLSAAEFRAFRVPMGVYEQRENGRYMLRCRFPGGAIAAAQLRALAEVSRRFGDGVLHVTSRQDVQVHGVELPALHPALACLLRAGVSTKGGGGNTVRNVIACPLAGACPHEVLDVTPHVRHVTRRLLAQSLSFQLPRKYKLAFSGCGEDCAGATVSDLGFVATRRDGRVGFEVHVGGGLGARSRVAERLEQLVPAEEAPLVAEAVERVFDRHGNRRNRGQARLRFLLERIGLDELRRLYRAEKAALAANAQPPVGDAARVEAPAAAAEPSAASRETAHAGLRPWQRSAVTPEKTPGRVAVLVPCALGSIRPDAALALAGVAERYGDGILHATQTQNLSIRGVDASALASLRRELETAGLGAGVPPALRDMTVCAGASTCRLGICLSRGLAAAIAETLAASSLERRLAALPPVRLHLSGCPNACGRHPLAQIGLYGIARRVEGRLVPHYVVQLGGRLGIGRTRLAEGHWAVPARVVPGFVADFLEAFVASGEADLDGFIDGHGPALAERLAARRAAVPSFESDESFYRDWSAQEPFTLAGRGPGECGAGVFDLIDIDLAAAAEALAAGAFHRATTLASRALLVTRGEQPVDAAEALAVFDRLFVAEGLVERSFAELVREARALADAPEREAAFASRRDAVRSLLVAVRGLYDSMDASLRFPVEHARERDTASGISVVPASPEPAGAPLSEPAVKTLDYRGVACPLNFVKTKMALERLRAGERLLVLLSEAGARSVPASIQKDGHEVVSLDAAGDHWRLLIRRAGPAAGLTGVC